MMKAPTAIFGLGLLSALAAAQPSPKDRMFVKEAWQGNRAEVMLGRLAAQRGGSASIRSFGQQMVADHGKANVELQRLAFDKRITVPVRVKPEAEDLRRRLMRLRGEAFDRLYRKEMIEDHQKDIAAFRSEAAGGRDTAIRGWARKTVPTLRMHLQMIQAARV